MNEIKPRTSHIHNYKGKYTNMSKQIIAEFGGENKKKTRKLKKYIP